MTIDRREFLGRSVGLVTISALVPRFGIAGARFFEESVEAAADRVLVVLELAGGNDGLNTVIPYTDALYLTHRARIGVPATFLVNGIIALLAALVFLRALPALRDAVRPVYAKLGLVGE